MFGGWWLVVCSLWLLVCGWWLVVGGWEWVFIPDRNKDPRPVNVYEKLHPNSETEIERSYGGTIYA